MGTNATPQYGNGRITLQIALNGNATEAGIQTFLRGMTFSTKGKGLKTLTRTVDITLTDANGLPSTIHQTINVRKKA